MNKEVNKILASFQEAILNSPFLSIMIVDKDLNIVWHNNAFAKNFDKGDNLVGMKCYEVTGSKKQHEWCPTQISLHKRKYTKGFYDFGDKNFFVLTLPLANKHVAKLHAFLPKQVDNSVEEM